MEAWSKQSKYGVFFKGESRARMYQRQEEVSIALVILELFGSMARGAPGP